jgi:hypothetical protein
MREPAGRKRYRRGIIYGYVPNGVPQKEKPAREADGLSALEKMPA